MNRDSAFFKSSSKIAARFLQTAVIIDDRAFVKEIEPDYTQPLIAPPSLATSKLSEDPPSPTPTTPPVSILAAPNPHGLDAHAVIDGYARKGIVCSVLCRQPEDVLGNPLSRLSQLAEVADILVIDWNIHLNNQESSEETLELLEKAIQKNIDETPRQLRLIVVYTGELDLNSVADKIRNRLTSKFGDIEADGDFAFIRGAVRIVVLAKKTIMGRSTDAKKQETDFGDLADRTIAEFTEMTAGIVSNFALDSMARLRKATHSVLNRFNPSLDSAFLLHRCLIAPPQEADEHLAPIIAAELQAIIEDGAQPLSPQIIAEWFEQRPDTHATYGFSTPAEERQFLVKLCDAGHKQALAGTVPSQIDRFKNLVPKATLNELINLIAGSETEDSNENLAMLMAVKARYSSELPYLTLGTIVAQAKDTQTIYWLCLQPSCDCIRLDGVRGFPMLRLSQSMDRFGLVIKHDDKFVHLRVDPRPFKVRTVEFKPDSAKKCVLSERRPDGSYWFKSKDPNYTCRWIADLKFEQAHRAVQALSSQNSRVGLTESEWQRRWDLANFDV